MSTPLTQTRRRYLRLSACAGLLGLAGCSGNAAEGDGTPGSTDDGQGSHEQSTDAHESSPESSQTETGHGHEERIGEPADSAEVKLLATDDGYHFDPHVVWVKPGGAVTWTLDSGSHTATAYHPDNDAPLRMPDGATPWDSGMMSEQDATFEHTFETEGVYDYYCVPHEATGMVASVLVGEPDPHEQPGLEAPQEGLPEAARRKIQRLNDRVNQALGHEH